MESLTSNEKLRYSRQIKLPEVGEKGQKKIKGSSVLIVGMGGLGTPAALYLASAGVGHIGIADFDSVQISNLHRQILYNEHDVSAKKVEKAVEKLRRVNSEIKLSVFSHGVSEENVKEIISGFDLVIDGSDNFKTRYLLNDACYFSQKPLVSAAISKYEGQLTLFQPRGGGCYRCVFPNPPSKAGNSSCEEEGVLGVLPGVMGLLQATEALKYILQIGNTLKNELLVFNALEMTFEKIKYCPHTDCILCGDSPDYSQLKKNIESCQPMGLDEEEISVDQFILWQKSGVQFRLLDVREEHEREQDFIENSDHIPLGRLEASLGSLEKHGILIVYCASGARSLAAVKLLREKGWGKALNLIGGIRRYRAEKPLNT
ncbi:MAG: HesA/MoeB/ThiF family protein [Bdellovibrionales bacterium]|nr:HesA/MoeB/ThiF family protein [Bdellovibrionales bacterium]